MIGFLTLLSGYFDSQIVINWLGDNGFKKWNGICIFIGGTLVVHLAADRSNTDLNVIQQPYMTPSPALLQYNAQPYAYQIHDHQAASYPAASYSQAFGPSAPPPPYAPYHQDTYNTAERAAPAQPMAMAYELYDPQKRQFAPPSYHCI